MMLKFSLTFILLAAISCQAMAFDPNKALEGHNLKRIGLEGQELRDAGVVRKGDLFWMRCSMGQEWSGFTCLGKPTTHVWDDAKALPSLMNDQGGFAGVTDWRLPTIFELYSLVVCLGGEKPELILPPPRNNSVKCSSHPRNRTTIRLSDFPGTSKSSVWTSTSNLTEHHAWWVNFENGEAWTGGRNYPRGVRLVRDKCVSCPAQ